MSKKKFEYIIAASQKGFTSTFGKGQKAVRAFNKEVKNGNNMLTAFQNQLGTLAGAYIGWETMTGLKDIIVAADTAAFGLENSLEAANRQFDLGTLSEWESALAKMSDRLKIYSTADLKEAAAATIDMTKRLGLSTDQMLRLIEVTGDLSAGRTDMANGIERVTSAIRGEAEASEYLGLTLNETFVKGWHEAHNSMNIAWKDLTDLQKAQVRYNVFLEQAEAKQGKAAKSTTSLAGAYLLVKKNIHDSLAEHKELSEITQDLAKYMAENSEAVGDLAASVAGGVAWVTKFVVNHQDLVKWLGLGSIALLGLSKLIKTVTTLYRGLSAACLVLTGSQLVPWLVGLRTALLAAAAGSTTLMASGIFGIAGLVAYDVLAIKELITQYQTLKKIKAEIAEQEASNARANDKVAARLKEISDATGVTVTTMKEFNKAVADGKIRADETTSTWVAGSAAITKATTSAMTEQATITKTKLAEMEKAYKQYATEVKRLQEEIVGRERSLAAELRELARSGMSDLGAWKDRKKEADEYYLAAEKAAKAGDFKTAVTLADEAKQAYADLNGEVKKGDAVLVSQAKALKTAMTGVKQAGDLAVESLQKQKETAAQAADALNTKSGGVLSKEWLSDAKKGTDDLSAAAKVMAAQWNAAWQDAEKDGIEAIATLENKLKELTRDRHVKIFIEETVKKATGGAIGFNRGGKLGGYGGGDRIRALLEAGEFVIRKEAVRKYGAGLFHALNTMQFNGIEPLRAKLGGLISQLSNQPIRMNQGGQVPSTTSGNQQLNIFQMRWPDGSNSQLFGSDNDIKNFAAKLQQYAMGAAR